ncbi:phytanoyl-CoA dioxygenase family protein [Microlunatus soli]|uniref:Ectoine hydroxylase-related dioxygenase, phytanoyl-CoA dioxygenase (PhyH) family n=1 Tax=Microlunatus soli TaxID=630515 RepID=A0A1H1SM56_9ACTN|nr:phytanoyl-CoA dioxygenase family protein [Microlunatus soli]SDS49065.1 Ectoine hydroxylase-related dioxygenase, phytanoyl-CoA dioxygenase (PhyH) family [Microlunatus soli]
MRAAIKRQDDLSGNARMRAGNQGSLSEEQVRQYDTEGYLVLPDLLSEQQMAPVRAALTEKVDRVAADLLAAGLIDDPLTEVAFPYRLARLFEGLEPEHFLEHGRSWRDRIAGYYTLMSNPTILDAVESLIGPEIFSNPVYNVRPKVPKIAAGAVPWHQDKSYWPDANSNPVITVWISFVDATLENGCLHVYPRTQRQRVLGYHQENYSGTGFLEVDVAELGSVAREPVALPVRAGTAILFNDRLVHSSTPNDSDHVRWSVDLRYQPTDQDPMPQHGAGFLARSRRHPERVAGLEDWLAERPETAGRS